MTNQNNTKESLSKPTLVGGIRDFLREHSSEISSISGLLAVLIILYGGLTFILRTPDVVLTVDHNNISLPISLGDKMAEVLSAVSNTELPEKATISMQSVLDFLQETKSLTTIRLSNHSDRSIQNLDLRVRPVRALTGWSVGGENITERESEEIISLVDYGPESDVVSISRIRSIPPQSTLEINIWGDHRMDLLFFDQDPVTATYEGGAASIVRTREVTGFDAFIYSNAELLVLVFLGLLFLVGIRANVHRHKTES